MDLYHVLNRGTEKREIFLDTEDYARFVHDMYEFNDKNPVNNNLYWFNRRPNNTLGSKNPPHEYKDVRHPYIHGEDIRKKIVDIHAWCLMKNHYHLLLSERIEGGISLFLQKVNTGYVKYFNEKYTRSGCLYQGKTKKILIEKDGHFMHIFNYIHLNPLDYLTGAKNWRSKCLKNAEKATEYLESYKWSSYLDYIGQHNFPSILTTKLFGDVPENHRKKLATYLRELAEESPTREMKLE